MSRVPFNRSALDAAASGAKAQARAVGAGNAGIWPSDGAGGGFNTVDFTPETYLARLTADRTGAAYGWERVYVEADGSGAVTVGVWENGDANSGTSTSLPAIDPNGVTTHAPDTLVYIRPCEQGGTWQYYIVGGVGGGGCADATLCDGAWRTVNPVIEVELDCTAGTLTLTVTKDGSRDYWTRDTPP